MMELCMAPRQRKFKMSTHAFANMLGPDLYHTHNSYLKRLFYTSKHNATKNNRAALLIKTFIYVALFVYGTLNTSNRAKAFVLANSYVAASVSVLLLGMSFILVALSNFRIL